jgi:AMP nucleosidase
MVPHGVKTDQSDKSVTSKFVDEHIEVGIDALIELRDSGNSVKHMKFS